MSRGQMFWKEEGPTLTWARIPKNIRKNRNTTGAFSDSIILVLVCKNTV